MQVYIKNINDIGGLVKSVRLQKGLTQEKAAALTGVGRRFFSELERGSKSSLDFGKSLQVLRRLGIKVILEANIDD